MHHVYIRGSNLTLENDLLSNTYISWLSVQFFARCDMRIQFSSHYYRRLHRIKADRTALQLRHWTVNSRSLHSNKSVKCCQIMIVLRISGLSVFAFWNQFTRNLTLHARNSFQNRNLLRANSRYNMGTLSPMRTYTRTRACRFTETCT